MGDKLKGSCMCGKVTYEITGEYQEFLYCFCSRCRKVTGSAHASNIYVLPEQFRWLSGREHAARWEMPGHESFSTGFCRTCGSHIPYAVKSGKTVVVPAGSLDEEPGHKPKDSIFWSSGAGWYLNPDLTRKHDEYIKD